MTNLSKFHIVFSSSALIHLNKDAFEEHLGQTVNNFVKQNKSSRLSPLRKRRSSIPSSISETLGYLVYLLLTNLAARRCTLSILSLLYFWYWSQTVAPYSIKEGIKERKAVCLSFSRHTLMLRRKNESLDRVSLVCHGCYML